MKHFQFCPMCGHHYQENDFTDFQYLCQNCDYSMFENLITAVGAIIIQNQKLLMVKRAFEPQKDTWDLPGGFTQANEHPKESLQREVREELSVEASIKQLFGIYAPNAYLYKGKYNYVCDIFYRVELENNRLQPADDVASFQWFSLDKLPSIDSLAFDSTKQVIQEIQQSKTM